MTQPGSIQKIIAGFFKNRHLLFIISLFIVSDSLISCNSSRITTSWSERKVIDAASSKIIVIALVPANERTMAAQLEKHLAGDLVQMGYTALSAYELYGPLAFCPGNDSIVFGKLAEKGITDVLTISLLNKKTEDQFIPGHYVNPVNFMDYVGPKYALLYEPAHMQTNTNYYWESRLYTIKQEELIYFSQTTSFAPASIQLMAHEYGRVITHNLVKKKVIVPVINALPDE